MEKLGFLAILKQSLGGAFGGGNENQSVKAEKLEDWFKAAHTGDRALLRKLLRSGIQIDSQSTQGRTALMVATYNRDEQTVAYLIGEGADVNLRDQRLNSPFLFAAAEGYVELLKLMTDTGDTKIVNRYGGIGIIPASERAHFETLEWLLLHTDSDVNHLNNLGWTALLEAIILGDGTEKYVKIIELLVANGASIDIADRDGVTPIEHAEKQGYHKILDVLQK
ncbi:hypothetical protein KZO01_11890 [Kurthia zopfii]|uniref:Ribulose-5-phosphate 4-epimerase and related epimerases and aldolases n=1 Tax=Kurthia zopfii TaxID=1650 RepID=A0A8B4Q3S8_9BACL|nr:ankyrin repeat domain-containing protein [Kurthia zopfii]PWI22086.1 hypothetical protein DF281_08760 [Kurthia zopfii]TDR37781.1 hypothetical protein DFR61_11917 [Kurthia zopfii]GEK30880.1 hypothetical protein KZO01_11890 [Kurthia zopfii]STX08457.1 Ribulose-5-phosphate 4-epimerase and related epimerases and aldolases [Kurthia zopfii]